MRFARFRDQVLFPIAYKIGLDPTTNFEDSQARAIGDYINMYVRRAWTAADWPEWEFVSNFVPGAGQVTQNHIVELNNDTVVGNFNVAKVLNVYLNDPSKYALPLEIPFELRQNGVYVGLDHGNQVWIRYLAMPPIYTAEVWNANRTYGVDEVTYSSTSGECYRSLVNGNKGNDPAGVTGAIPPDPTLVQTFIPGSPGFDGQNQISYIQMAIIDFTTIPDPPPASSLFKFFVYDSTGVQIANATHTSSGSESLATIMATLTTAIAADPDLATYVITQDPTDLLVNFSNASKFGLKGLYQATGGNRTVQLVVAQTQSYVPSTPPTDAVPQSTQIRLTNQDISPGATYQLTFYDPNGTAHFASYTAMKGDGIATTLAGIAANIQSQASTDSIFGEMITVVDNVNGLLTITTPTPGAFGFDWFFTPPPDPEPGGNGTWWAIQPFPYELVDVVIRGANAEVLKEWGQLQGGLAEEQFVAPEVQLRTTVSGKQDTNELRPRGSGRSRYSMK